MEIYEEKEVRKVQKVLVKTLCDICGQEEGTEGWDEDIYEINETEPIKMRVGTSYPETSWGETYKVDICPKCFKGKLIPWLESEGCDVEWEEWFY